MYPPKRDAVSAHLVEVCESELDCSDKFGEVELLEGSIITRIGNFFSSEHDGSKDRNLHAICIGFRQLLASDVLQLLLSNV